MYRVCVRVRHDRPADSRALLALRALAPGWVDWLGKDGASFRSSADGEAARALVAEAGAELVG